VPNSASPKYDLPLTFHGVNAVRHMAELYEPSGENRTAIVESSTLNPKALKTI
jgi:hypothetical protein